MDQGMNINFDHVLIYAGTYGMRSKGSGPVKFLNSAIYGGIPPWACYIENALHIGSPSYSEPYADGTGEKRRRNIARLTNHALMVLEGYEESDVFAYPFNNRWEILSKIQPALDAAGVSAAGLPHVHALFNLVALVAIFIVTTVLVIGIQESANFNSAIVIIKVSIVLVFIAIAGPAYCAAAAPVSTKIPAPMIAPIPSVIRFKGPRARFNACSPSFCDSRRIMSSGLVASRFAM
jgi:hypothetical protein